LCHAHARRLRQQAAVAAKDALAKLQADMRRQETRGTKATQAMASEVRGGGGGVRAHTLPAAQAAGCRSEAWYCLLVLQLDRSRTHSP
jgi:hypothetical protein